MTVIRVMVEAAMLRTVVAIVALPAATHHTHYSTYDVHRNLQSYRIHLSFSCSTMTRAMNHVRLLSNFIRVMSINRVDANSKTSHHWNSKVVVVSTTAVKVVVAMLTEVAVAAAWSPWSWASSWLSWPWSCSWQLERQHWHSSLCRYLDWR